MVSVPKKSVKTHSPDVNHSMFALFGITEKELECESLRWIKRKAKKAYPGLLKRFHPDTGTTSHRKLKGHNLNRTIRAHKLIQELQTKPATIHNFEALMDIQRDEYPSTENTDLVDIQYARKTKDNYDIYQIYLGDFLRTKMDLGGFMKHIEKRLIHQAMRRCSDNKTRVSQLLGVARTTLIEKTKRYFPEEKNV